ncbi:MAG: hypothetical protein IKW31_01900 [Alistipes sp.]|nr:hypothetical protein [Alistipes sp.]
MNNFEKFLRKCLEIKIKALPLHPQSGSNNDTESDKMVLRNIFEKKLPKNLVVSKMCFIFAPLFRLKSG